MTTMTIMYGRSQMWKRQRQRESAHLWRITAMSKIIDSKGNIFGALKLIEQLYLDGQIPGYIFRNIMKEYGNDIEVESFKCYANEAHALDEVETCTE